MKIDLYLLDNPIQPYAWGSHSAIAGLLGQVVPSPNPQAEVWMGAHPKAPSRLQLEGQSLTLDQWIAQDPEAILGDMVCRRHQNQLPFLFKVLAAAQPLSIQVHPNRKQAAEGYEQEEQQAIPFDAPHRNYRDPHHKPELICALEPFWALQGFRTAGEIQQRLKEIKLDSFCQELNQYLQQSGSEEEGLRQFFAHMMTLPKDEQASIVALACQEAQPLAAQAYTYQWLLRLNDTYPGDIGVLAPLFLNLVQLRPGEALYQNSGQIHAYLEGFGVELMANSDNVLRAGLTRKHIDLPELLKVGNFKPTPPNRIQPRRISSQEVVYLTPASEFVLYRANLDGNLPYNSTTQRSIEILLCTEGTGSILNPDTQTEIALKPGVSILVPANVRQYQIQGKLTVFRAAVPVTTS